METKTRDNAVVTVETRLHYRVLEEKVVEAFYRFTNPDQQIASFTSSVVRGVVPKYTLDEVFLMSDEIKKAVDEDVSERLSEFGFVLESTLLTKIDPSPDVKEAIAQTQVNAYRRTAAEHQAELNKIVAVKQAEADFEEKRLSGVGLALERKAIMSGLQSSIEEFVNTVPGMTAKDVMNLLLMNQYFDAIKDIGATEKNRVIVLPGLSGGPGSSILQELLAAQVSANKMS